jgi:hypothetical protein
MKVTVVWDVTSYSLVDSYQQFLRNMMFPSIYQNTWYQIPDNSNLDINVLFVTFHKSLDFIFTVSINLKVLLIENVKKTSNILPNHSLCKSPEMRVYVKSLYVMHYTETSVSLEKLTFVSDGFPNQSCSYVIRVAQCSRAGMSNSTCTEGHLSPINNSPGPHFKIEIYIRF